MSGGRYATDDRHGRTAAARSASASAARAADLVRRGDDGPGPGDAWAAGGAGGWAARGRVAGFAALRLGVGAVRRRGRHRLRARPTHDAAYQVWARPRAGGAADDPGADRRRPVVRAAAISPHPAADRPAARPYSAIRA